MPLGSFTAGVTEKRRSQTVTLLSHGHFQADQILLAITGHPPYRVTNARVPAHGFACLKEIAQRQTKTRIKIAHRDFEMQQPHHVTAARACGFHKSVQYQICPRRRALTANAMSFPIGCGPFGGLAGSRRQVVPATSHSGRRTVLISRRPRPHPFLICCQVLPSSFPCRVHAS